MSIFIVEIIFAHGDGYTEYKTIGVRGSFHDELSVIILAEKYIYNKMREQWNREEREIPFNPTILYKNEGGYSVYTLDEDTDEFTGEIISITEITEWLDSETAASETTASDEKHLS